MAKTNKQIQVDHRNRKRGKGLIPKELWVHPDDWPELRELYIKINKKRLDIITSNDIIKSS